MSPTVAAAGLARALAAIAGEAYATEDPARTTSFAIDEVVPRAAVEPGSAAEVAAVLQYAHARKLVVAPAGGFTHQHTGGIPERVDILLRTERLKAVEHYDPGDMMIGVGVGTTWPRSSARSDRTSRYFPWRRRSRREAQSGER